MKKFTKVLVAIALLIGMTSTIQAQSKVAHINSQGLVEAMPSYKSAMSDLEKLQASYQTDIHIIAKQKLKPKKKTLDAFKRLTTQKLTSKNINKLLIRSFKRESKNY